jgi:aminoglycoside phosphotransferase family enzyme
MGKAARAVQISNKDKLANLKKIGVKTIKKDSVQPVKTESEQLALLLASGARVKANPKSALLSDPNIDQEKKRKMTSKTRRRLQLIKAKPVRDVNPAKLVDK